LLLVASCGIAVFFLIQPVIVAAQVVLALNNFNPQFASNLMQQLRPDLGHIKLLAIMPALFAGN